MKIDTLADCELELATQRGMIDALLRRVDELEAFKHMHCYDNVESSSATTVDNEVEMNGHVPIPHIPNKKTAKAIKEAMEMSDVEYSDTTEPPEKGYWWCTECECVVDLAGVPKHVRWWHIPTKGKPHRTVEWRTGKPPETTDDEMPEEIAAWLSHEDSKDLCGSWDERIGVENPTAASATYTRSDLVPRWISDRPPDREKGMRVIAKSETVHPCVMSAEGVCEQWQSLFTAWSLLPPDEKGDD